MRAWAGLAALAELRSLQVIVDPESPLGRRGWISSLALGSTVTASVPRADLREPTLAALNGLTPQEATDPEVIVGRLPPSTSTLGPASLFYLPEGFIAPATSAEVAEPRELDVLLAEATSDDVDESGLAHIDSPAVVSRGRGGDVVAACGYRRWTNGFAHLSVLAHPAHREQGHGRIAASGAVALALTENLLPQWRARPLSSQRLALALGFVAMGAQFGVEPG